MTHWIEASMRVDGESAEAVAELLGRYGHQGVSLEQADIPPDAWDEDEVPPAENLILRAYFPDNADFPAKRSQLEQALRHMSLMYPMPMPSYSKMREEDWAEAWKAHYRPQRVGRRMLIRPLWIDAKLSESDIEIALDPGMAFGTGAHPTTQLCLEALEETIQPGQIALDLGCGSGILAIAAAKMGAANVTALDIDPIAVAATKENARHNGVEGKIIVERGSLDSLLTSARRFDLMIVNILARVIMEMAERPLGQVLRPGGTALFSGIIDAQIDEVEAALRSAGLAPISRRHKGDWALIVAERPIDRAS